MMMDEPKSKSQLKRDVEALKKMGSSLIELPSERLRQLPLSDALIQAITEAKNIKSHGAKRRQAQWIGKLMREAPHEEIAALLEQWQSEDSGQTADFHAAEQWRERLINEGKDALTEFMSTYPQTDSQQLRHLVKKAIDDVTHQKNTGAQKALFRFLRTCMS